MKPNAMTAIDTIRMCLFVGICGLLFLFGKELFDAQVRYNTLEHELFNNQKTADEIIRDLRKKVTRADFIRSETECLAKNIFFEAQVEEYRGKMAVATVTVNRAQSKRFPATICGVVMQRSSNGCQFSWVCDNKSDIVTNKKEYMKSVAIAESVVIDNKRLRELPFDTLYYHADYVTPDWAKTKKLFAKIGTHIFYRG